MTDELARPCEPDSASRPAGVPRPSSGALRTVLPEGVLARVPAVVPTVARTALLAVVSAAALSAGPCKAQAAPACPIGGEPVQWAADYCMLKLQTDDEIAVSDCIASEIRVRPADACAGKRQLKRRLCALAIRSGGRTGSVQRCVEDPGFMGRTVAAVGVGG